MKAKYKDIKFKTAEAFEKWLKETTKWEIELEDMGQDFLRFYVAENGEILHAAPFGASLWNGQFIITNKIFLHEGGKIVFPQTQSELKYPIKKVTEYHLKTRVLKKCSTCGEFLTLDNFYRDKTGKSRLRAQCKNCQRKKINEITEKNKDQVLSKKRAKYQKEKSVIKIKRKIHSALKKATRGIK